jgi:rod shape-determining protein MreC
MESVVSRYRNLIVLVGVLFAQVLGLALQVKRTNDAESTRLIRIWAVGAVTPIEKTLYWIKSSTGGLWHNYIYLRGVRAENRALKQEIERMRLEQASMAQDADQAHRLQALLAFKERFISQTTAAQVIGTTGSEHSRSIYIDKGGSHGIKRDMAVITKDGIVGKVLYVYPSTSLVLLIDDESSGVGAILDKERLQGILRGTPSGEVVLDKVMGDETVPVGAQVLTSGGDGVFPKGLPVGKVTRVTQGGELLNIQIHPAANLGSLEEVLVVTKIDERQAQPDQSGPVRAADILSERLPSVPPKPENASDTPGKNASAPPGGAANTPAAPPASGQTTPQTSAVSAPASGATHTGVANAAAPKTKTTPKTATPESPPPIVKKATPSLNTAAAVSSAGMPVAGTAGAVKSPLPGSASTPASAVKKPAPKPTNSAPAAKPQPAAQDAPQ